MLDFIKIERDLAKQPGSVWYY